MTLEEQRLDIDKAREIVLEVKRTDVEPTGMSEAMEQQEVLNTIRSAEKTLLGV